MRRSLPANTKPAGHGLEITYDFVPSPFGLALPMVTARGLCGLAFCDEGGEAAAFEDMRRRWPQGAIHRANPRSLAPMSAAHFRAEAAGGRINP